ncbi:hypothetical protein [Nocardioides jishulii]|uniref:Uncharacterized protein n=1 Tax=Nocardioides jishulii TaxID=2575440 RepID=A0A4V5TKK0_9ACTN|nr:hypothetical protein [Nocardioides jishulii]QCX27717.1 hypothetical protein FCL41_09405 [Nocardioides jishulii]TKI62523.1 hypothetical protein FC770_09070 [Nocardioides jishulii]
MPSTPNAICPVCGAAVFFWKNSHGSKVWFDALGAPWPKHPCLDLDQVPLWRRNGVHSARVAAEYPLPAARRILDPGPETSSCGCFILMVIAFYIPFAVFIQVFPDVNTGPPLVVLLVVALALAILATRSTKGGVLTTTPQAEAALKMTRKPDATGS